MFGYTFVIEGIETSATLLAEKIVDLALLSVHVSHDDATAKTESVRVHHRGPVVRGIGELKVLSGVH